MSEINEMKKPIISVIVPIYNVELYLEECIDSILNQSYKNLEVILVDDGSLDSCGQICENYKIKDSRIKVIHKKNGGLSDARNAGMKYVEGEYVTFVDSDDYIADNFISVLYETLRSYDADISISKMKRTSRRNEKSNGSYMNMEVFGQEEAMIRMLYGTPYGTSACAKLYKKKLFENIEFPVGKFSEDLFTIYKTILKSTKIVFANFDGYFYYYRSEGSIVVSKYKTKHLEALEAMNEIHALLGHKKCYKKSMASQYINIIYDIAAKEPNVKEFNNVAIQEPLHKYRKIVALDGLAPKRLRVFALISYMGNCVTLPLIAARNNKWK